MSPRAVTDRLSISTVVITESSLDPRLTPPLVAVSTTLPPADKEPMVMPPVLDTRVMLPATPVMAPMVIGPSASMVMLPSPRICSEVRFNAPLWSMVRSPGAVMTMAMAPTSDVRLRSPPTCTSRVLAVTVPPRVMPPPARKRTSPSPLRPTLISDTTTRSPVPATRLISSSALVGSETTVRLSSAARPKSPGVRSGMIST